MAATLDTVTKRIKQEPTAEQQLFPDPRPGNRVSVTGAPGLPQVGRARRTSGLVLPPGL